MTVLNRLLLTQELSHSHGQLKHLHSPLRGNGKCWIILCIQKDTTLASVLCQAHIPTIVRQLNTCVWRNGSSKLIEHLHVCLIYYDIRGGQVREENLDKIWGHKYISYVGVQRFIWILLRITLNSLQNFGYCCSAEEHQVWIKPIEATITAASIQQWAALSMNITNAHSLHLTSLVLLVLKTCMHVPHYLLLVSYGLKVKALRLWSCYFSNRRSLGRPTSKNRFLNRFKAQCCD